MYFIYLLACSDGSIYTGITTDLERRYQEHREGKGARYTRAHKPVRLLYSEAVGTRSAALKREAAIKRMPRAQKLQLTRRS